MPFFCGYEPGRITLISFLPHRPSWNPAPRDEILRIIVNPARFSFGATKKRATDNIRIIMLNIILTLKIGVARVLNRVSPSVIPVMMARIRVNGKTKTEKVNTFFSISG